MSSCSSFLGGFLPPPTTPSGGGGSGIDIFENVYTPTAAQTVFTLTNTWGGTYAVAFVNGVEYILTVDFTISGTTFTWLDTPFILATTDRLVVDYDF